MLAGCNGAGKSSVGGAGFRANGADYFNPDEAAQRIAAANAHLARAPSQEEINAAAWNEGRRLLERAIAQRLDFAFETTLGGVTMTGLLFAAARAGIDVHVWFVGLASLELHLARIRRRVERGGHDIPAAKVRERYDTSRQNLLRLLPHLASLSLYDNSREGDPAAGIAPRPRLVMRCHRGRITRPGQLRSLLADTPEWARPLVAAALEVHLRRQREDRRSRSGSTSGDRSG